MGTAGRQYAIRAKLEADEAMNPAVEARTRTARLEGWIQGVEDVEDSTDLVHSRSRTPRASDRRRR